MIGFNQINKYEINDFSTAKKLKLAVGAIFSYMTSKVNSVHYSEKVSSIEVWSKINSILHDSKVTWNIFFWKIKFDQMKILRIYNILASIKELKIGSEPKQTEVYKKGKTDKSSYNSKYTNINKKGK